MAHRAAKRTPVGQPPIVEARKFDAGLRPRNARLELAILTAAEVHGITLPSAEWQLV